MRDKILWGVIFFIVACIGVGIVGTAIENETIGDLLKEIGIYVGGFLGIIAIIFIVASWDKIPGTKHYNSHRTVKELETLLRKELLPLGFQEERDPRAPAQGFIRGDIRANIFEHKNNQSLNFIIQKTSETPYLTLVSVEKSFREEEDFKVEVIQKFKYWLASSGRWL
ncbi:MAG: hypothetical protein HN392_06200 [Anaerolineae bacterium]|nr:hypothetical protein [Anaerolineae bacterium]MBT7075360.1 hypothetical protein [Anaerolineae bacterium]